MPRVRIKLLIAEFYFLEKFKALCLSGSFLLLPQLFDVLTVVLHTPGIKNYYYLNLQLSIALQQSTFIVSSPNVRANPCYVFSLSIWHLLFQLTSVHSPWAADAPVHVNHGVTGPCPPEPAPPAPELSAR